MKTEIICQIPVTKVLATKYVRNFKEKVIFVPAENLLFIRKFGEIRLLNIYEGQLFFSNKDSSNLVAS